MNIIMKDIFLFMEWANKKNYSLKRIKEFNKKLEGYNEKDSSLIAEIEIDEGESYREHLLIVKDCNVEKHFIDELTFII